VCASSSLAHVLTVYPVLGLNAVLQGIGVSALPPNLAANTTQLQVVDLFWLPAQGGALPSEYGKWTKLDTLRYGPANHALLRQPTWGHVVSKHVISNPNVCPVT
jgi:hypothetical protein